METRQAVALPDAEYDAMRLKAKMRGKRGYTCFDKSGNKHKFYMKGDELYGEHNNQEYLTMSMTEALAKKAEMEARPDSFKASTKSKMRKDFPDLSEEELNANVDIVSEANDSIKRLITAGIAPEVAYKIIMGTLHSDETNNLIIKELSATAKSN